MAKKETTERKPFNFGDSPLVKTTEQTVVEGYEAIEKKEQGGGEQPATDERGQMEEVMQKPLLMGSMPNINEQQIRAAAEKAGRSINIELPLSLHTRLKIACASQNRKIKDIVPEIIAAWVDQVEASSSSSSY